ncbi:MAG: ISNCY family transposase, partial [Thermodesulfobacteriota bacterium]
MTRELTMTLKEADRLAVMKRVESKNLSLGQAARELGTSYRQMKRIWRRYKQGGAEGLISLRRGKPSPNRLSIKLRERALKIIQAKYPDYGPTLAAEKLKGKHKLELSKETIRKLMIGAGLRKSKRRRDLKVYSRRTRRSRIGELVQIDGSYEHWFEDRGEKCCLIVFVDDASSRIQLMRFSKNETSEDYLKLLDSYLRQYGRVSAFYSDKHSVFRVTRKERNEDRKWTTRFHEVLKELDIELICAHSPQAKGRVERAHGTLQDRLIKELRERKISSIEEGNLYINEFTEFYNNKFGKEPASQENAHRAL